MRTLGVDPCQKLLEPDANHFRQIKCKNSENIRQFDYKLEQTNTVILDLFGENNKEFIENIKILDWQ